MKKHLPTLLAEVRAATKWSQVRLAIELGVTQPTVNRILNGQAKYKADTYCAVVALHESKCGSSTTTKETT